MLCYDGCTVLLFSARSPLTKSSERPQRAVYRGPQPAVIVLSRAQQVTPVKKSIGYGSREPLLSDLEIRSVLLNIVCNRSCLVQALYRIACRSG